MVAKSKRLAAKSKRLTAKSKLLAAKNKSQAAEHLIWDIHRCSKEISNELRYLSGFSQSDVVTMSTADLDEVHEPSLSPSEINNSDGHLIPADHAVEDFQDFFKKDLPFEESHPFSRERLLSIEAPKPLAGLDIGHGP